MASCCTAMIIEVGSRRVQNLKMEQHSHKRPMTGSGGKPIAISMTLQLQNILELGEIHYEDYFAVPLIPLKIVRLFPVFPKDKAPIYTVME